MNLLSRNIKDYPLAKKLTYFCVLSSALSLSLAMAIIVIYDQLNFKETFKAELSVLASVVSNRSSAAVVFDDKQLATNNLSSLSFHQSIKHGCIYKVEQSKSGEKNTTVLAQYPDQISYCPSYTTKTLSFFESDQHTGFLEVVQPIELDGNIVGYLYLNVSLEVLENRLNKNLSVFFMVMLIACCFIWWLASLIAQYVSAPLQTLNVTAQSITKQDDYSIRAKKESNDEIGQVVDSFNHMLDFIELEDLNLRESEEKFRLISSASKVGIFQLDTQGKCVYVNDEMSAITGIEKSEIITTGWLSALHPEDTHAITSKWQAMLQQNQAININCRLKSSEIKWINGHVGLLKRADGKLIGYLGTITDITDVKTAQVQLEQMAFYDNLTGLANRRLFRNRLEHVLGNITREGNSLGLILLDLDQFKNINDSLGHDAGDALLKIIAERLQRCVRSSDTVARLGGDEFAIILPAIISTLAVSHVSQKILNALKVPIFINETEIRISASLGIALSPEDSLVAEGLIKNADLALYRAKDMGRDNYQFFTEEMNTRLVDHISMVNDLRDAMGLAEFHLVFQPQVDVASDELIGFEALVRWISPSRGFVSPVDFIPVAEDTGLIIELGRWVIVEACKQLRELNDKHLISDKVAVTVNLSVKQFQDEELVGFIDEQLNKYQLKPHQFEVELTESVLMENLEDALIKLEAIRKLGILISIDDFGTGYSSLGYLKRLPVDILKVDRSFVMDIPDDKDDMEITAAVIAMAHKLGYKVVAEGVETSAQLDFLASCDCDYGQGYFYSKPLIRQDLIDYCATKRPATTLLS